MSGIKTMAEMKQIAKNQSETIKQQNEILANQARDLQMKAQQLEMERIQFEASRNADIRHQVNQCVDFAIRSLPWWSRGTKKVVNRASEYLLTIKHETGKHVAMEELTQRLQNEKIAEEQAVSLSEVTVAETPSMYRESAELEQK